METGATRPLGTTGLSLTQLGFGGAPLGNLYAPVSESEAHSSLDTAWQRGIRYFDTAPFYGAGLSEHRIGEAMRRHDRESMVLSSKVGRLLTPRRGPEPPDAPFPGALPFNVHFDYSYDGVMRSLEDSYQRLGTDHIDIVFIHDIGAFTHGQDAHPALMREAMTGGYRALEGLRRSGAIKAIGLGVNEWEVCVEAMDHGDFDVFLLAGRYTLLEQGSLDVFFPRLERAGAAVIIGGAFNSGILASGAPARQKFNYAPAPKPVQERAEALRVTCQDFGVPLPAAALQFPLHHPRVVSVLPGCANAAELTQNIEYFETEIPAGLWAALKDQELIRHDAPTP